MRVRLAQTIVAWMRRDGVGECLQSGQSGASVRL